MICPEGGRSNLIKVVMVVHNLFSNPFGVDGFIPSNMNGLGDMNGDITISSGFGLGMQLRHRI